MRYQLFVPGRTPAPDRARDSCAAYWDPGYRKPRRAGPEANGARRTRLLRRQLRGWPTGEEPVRFSSAALCSLSSLHLRLLTQRLTTQLPRNGNAPIVSGSATKQSGSLRRRFGSKGRWRYLTLPDSNSVRLHALLVPVCRVDLRPGSPFLPSGSSAVIELGTLPCPSRSLTQANHATHRPELSLSRAELAIQNP